jgi:hypothetical protein
MPATVHGLCKKKSKDKKQKNFPPVNAVTVVV